MATNSSSLLLSLRRRVQFPSPGIYPGFSHLFDQQNAVDGKPDPEMTCGLSAGCLKHSFCNLPAVLWESWREDSTGKQWCLCKRSWLRSQPAACTNLTAMWQSYLGRGSLAGWLLSEDLLQRHMVNPGALPQMHIPKQNKSYFLISVPELGDRLLYSRI